MGSIFSYFALSGLVSPLTSGQAVNGSNCAVSLKSQPSDPASQSGIASILLTSTVDASLEYVGCHDDVKNH